MQPARKKPNVRYPNLSKVRPLVTAAAVTVNTGPSDCIGRLTGREGESISRLGTQLTRSLVDRGMRAKGPQWHVQCQWHRGSTVRPLHSVTAACASGKIGLWARAG